MHLAVFTTDLIPVTGLPASGVALRTFGIGEGFRANGWKVTYCVPRRVLGEALGHRNLSLASRNALNELAANAYDKFNADRVVRTLSPDLILCGHWPAFKFRQPTPAETIIDLAGPHLLERFHQGESISEEVLQKKRNVLKTADRFIASGELQRSYFKSFFAEGKAPRIDLLTMALPPQAARNSFKSGEPRFIFTGYFLPWQNPEVALRTIAKELQAHQNGELRLIGGHHPSFPINSPDQQRVFHQLKAQPKVSYSPPLPIEELQRELLAADVALDLMERNLERELAVPIRTTLYLHAGLPVIFNNYSDLSLLIAKYNAGWCIENSETEIQNLVRTLINDPSEIALRSEGAYRLAQREFSWDNAVKPLLS